MATQQVVTTADLARRIQIYTQEKFTGQLNLQLKEPKSQQWNLYFRMGSLIWVTSEVHPIRRCYRLMSQQCPQLAIYSTRLQYWDYEYLAELTKQGRIQRKQMAAVVESNVTEILFDIQQEGALLRYGSGFQVIAQPISKKTIDLIDSTLVMRRADEAWQLARQDWEAWRQAGLATYSPNQAPVIWKAEELQRQTSLLAYNNLTTLADGNQTLRDLATKLRQNVLLLSQSLMPSIRQGLMGLIDVEDFNSSVKPATANSPQTVPIAPPAKLVQPQPTSPLVAYIDDSRNDSLIMANILSQAGYRFINIQDPVTALVQLLEHKPQLIFLDLVMPIANGYEICAQIRRVSAFKETPVIILTSNDGIVDRVRAKMVGSSGFLAKPIEEEKVLAVLHRYLPALTSVQSQKPQRAKVWSPEQPI
jgi:two-component system, chemotaxis family, response regulator PixG